MLTHEEYTNELCVYTHGFEIFKKKTTISSDLSKQVVLPKRVYSIAYNWNIINFVNRLYKEGILLSDINKFAINSQPCVILDTVGTSDKDVIVTLTGEGYSDTNATIKVIKTDAAVLKNKTINVMCIGDSLTDQKYPALCDFITKVYNDGLRNINVIYIGTKIENATITLNDIQKTCRGCNEGRSGWAISDYLRHFSTIRSRYYSANQLAGKAAWDSLGLGTQTRNGAKGRDYVDWAYSYDNSELMRTTCHGYYDADPSEELWNWIVNVKGLKTFNYNDEQVTFSDSYTAEDDEKQKKAIKYLCENPENPFFDINTVISSNGSYAFNIETYLNRYKTITSNGDRLTVGDTAGTEVENVMDYDVCLPTHVVIIMNENDVNHNDNGANPVNDMLLCAKLIHNYNSSIKLSIGSTRGYGAINPLEYSKWGIPNKYSIDNRRLETWKTLLASDVSYIDILPIYSIQNIFGTSGGKAIDPINNSNIERCNGDGLHAGYTLGYLDRAYQVVSWIAYTLR